MTNLQKIFFSILALAVLFSGSALSPATAQAAAKPTVAVVEVVPDVSFTVQISGFATGNIDVTLGAASISSASWIKIASYKVKKGDTFTKTLNIPKKLKGVKELGVRVVGQNGLAAKTTFSNKPSNSNPGSINNRPSLAVTGYVYNKGVTLTATKLAPGVVYNVWIGSARRNRYSQVGTLSSPTGTTISGSFNLPVGLLNQKRIHVLLQDTTIPCSIIVPRSPCIVNYTAYNNRK